jgi:hypothetical protein
MSNARVIYQGHMPRSRKINDLRGGSYHLALSYHFDGGLNSPKEKPHREIGGAE